MYRKFLVAMIVTVTVATTSAAVVADDDPLEPLNRRIGTWVLKDYHKKAPWTPEAKTTDGEETVKWVLDKKYIQGDVTRTDGTKARWLVTYDAEAKVYRSWFFHSKHFPRGESVGHWDAKKERMDVKMDIGNGFRGEMSLQWSGKDKVEWTMVIRDASGKLMLDGGGTTTRKK
jgi:hypothetical protein